MAAQQMLCPTSTAMVEFKLDKRTVKSGASEFSFAFGCQGYAGVKSTTARSATPLKPLSEFFAVEPNVTCPKGNQALQAWRFVRQGSSAATARAGASFTCVEFNAPLSCAQRRTAGAPYARGDVASLAPHVVKCQPGELLSSWRTIPVAAAGLERLQVAYTCCRAPAGELHGRRHLRCTRAQQTTQRVIQKHVCGQAGACLLDANGWGKRRMQFTTSCVYSEPHSIPPLTTRVPHGAVTTPPA